MEMKTFFPFLDAEFVKKKINLQQLFSEQILSVVLTLNLVISENLNTNLPYTFVDKCISKLLKSIFVQKTVATILGNVYSIT